MRTFPGWVALVSLAFLPQQLASAPGAEPSADRQASVELRPDFLAKLRAPYISVLEGKPFGEALQEVASAAGVNLCLDRRVDRSRLVKTGTLGPVVWNALNSIAAEEECVCFPWADIVLVGRPAWVDRTATAIDQMLSVGNPPIRTEQAEVSWPEVTTPREALIVAAGTRESPVANVSLPHDLWPASDWRDVDRRVAVALILAQFDLKLATGPAGGAGDRGISRDRHPEASDRARVVEATGAEGRFSAVYPPGGLPVSRLLQAAREGDSQAETLSSGDRIMLLGNATAHRLATAALLEAAAPGESSRKTPSERLAATSRFTLRIKNKPAGEVLRQLAQAVGKDCRISESALPASETMISLESVDATIRELVEKVAAAAGLKVTWNSELQVDLP